MICDMCKKNVASVHIVKIINGVKQELNLCENCARETNQLGIGMGINFVNPFSFQNIFGGLADYIDQSSQGMVSNELTCPSCGTTYSEFREKGLVGCCNCYKSFNDSIVPVIKRVQGNNIQHSGKIPGKFSSEIINKRKMVKLKEELQKAILLEEYERAAQIRDEIKKLQKEGED